MKLIELLILDQQEISFLFRTELTQVKLDQNYVEDFQGVKQDHFSETWFSLGWLC